MLLLALSTPASATTMVMADLDHLASASDAIVVATVGRSRPVHHPRLFVEETELHVEHVVAGDAPDRVNLRQLGGIHDGLTTRIAGDAELAEGQRVVVCLQEGAESWTLTALAQSVWFVDGERADAPVWRDLAGLDLVELGLDGAFAPLSRSERLPTTLDTLTLALGGGW